MADSASIAFAGAMRTKFRLANGRRISPAPRIVRLRRREAAHRAALRALFKALARLQSCSTGSISPRCGSARGNRIRQQVTDLCGRARSGSAASSPGPPVGDDHLLRGLVDITSHDPGHAQRGRADHVRASGLVGQFPEHPVGEAPAAEPVGGQQGGQRRPRWPAAARLPRRRPRSQASSVSTGLSSRSRGMSWTIASQTSSDMRRFLSHFGWQAARSVLDDAFHHYGGSEAKYAGSVASLWSRSVADCRGRA